MWQNLRYWITNFLGSGQPRNYIMVVSHQRQYAFVMFPKSGSSSIKYILSNLHRKEFNIQDPTMDSHDLHIPFNHIDARDLPANYKIFVCVREPYARVCSMFFNRELDIADRNFNVDCSDIVASPRTFRQFVNMLSKTPDRLLDFHYRTQDHWIPTERVTYCFKLQNISTELPRVLATVGFTHEEVIAHMSRKEVVKRNLALYDRFADGALADYNFLEDPYDLQVIKNGAPSNQAMYVPELRQKVQERYSYDFDTYGFAR